MKLICCPQNPSYSKRGSMRTHTSRAVLSAALLATVLAVPLGIVAIYASDTWLEGATTFRFLINHRRVAGIALCLMSWFSCFFLFKYIFQRSTTIFEYACGIRGLPHMLELKYKPTYVMCGAAVLLACWTPIMILMFPGATTGGDTINQLYQYFSSAPTMRGLTGQYVDAEFINDNPIFDTLVFGWFISTGRMLGSDTIGFFCYCLMQTALVACVLSISICYGDRLSIPPAVRLALLIAVALNPLMPIAAFAMIKDSLHSAFLTLYTVIFAEIVLTGGDALRNRSTLFLYVAVSILTSLTKAAGIYVVLLSGLILVFIQRKRVLALALMASNFLLCAVLLPSILYVQLDVYTPMSPGGLPGSQMIFQQIIEVLREHPDELVAQDYGTLSSIIDVEKAMENYNPYITDGVIKSAKESSFNEESISLLKMWVKIGSKYPLSYVKTIAKVALGALIPTHVFNQDVFVYQNAIEHYSSVAAAANTSFTLDVRNPELLSGLAIDYRYFLMNILGVVPGISLFLTYGFYGGWLPIICIFICLYFNKRYLLTLIPSIITSLFLVGIPVLFARYVTPSLFLSVPALVFAIGALCSVHNQRYEQP